MPRPANKDIRTKILNVASTLFFNRGFSRVTISELVDELRTSKSTIYQNFVSKEAIVEVLLDEFNAEVDNKLREIVADDSKDFQNKFEEVTAHTCRMLSRVRRPFFKDLRIHTPELWQRYEKARLKRLDKFYRALFRAGKDQGIIRKDIDINFLLLLYTKLTEVLIEPDSLDNFSYSNKMAYKMISKTFLEGAMADGRKRCKE
jgi:AcrR family transcriptional regulator